MKALTRLALGVIVISGLQGRASTPWIRPFRGAPSLAPLPSAGLTSASNRFYRVKAWR